MEEDLDDSERKSANERPLEAVGHAVYSPSRGTLAWSSPTFQEWLAVAYRSDQDPLLQEISAALKGAGPGQRSGGAFEIRLPVGREEVNLIAYPFEHAGEGLVLLALSPPGSSRCEVPATSLDPVTQLPDRRALDIRLDALANRGGSVPPIAMLFVDLDGFKHVNDRQGHLVGDEVLATVARRLSQAIREIDFIARFGGDEFVVLVEGIVSAQKLAPLVERLRSAAQQQIETPSGRISLSASIGVALSSEGFSNPRQMLAAADTRMYAQKRAAP